MDIHHFDDYLQMSSYAASQIFVELKQKEDLFLCAASGNSPKGVYRQLVEFYEKEPEVFNNLRLIKLDEWGGIPMHNPQTCENFLQDNLVKPLRVVQERYISFQSNPGDPKAECSRIESLLKSSGVIDVCVLGLGQNGHVGFNEPGQYLWPHCHYTDLSKESLGHPMAKQMGAVPTYGLTIGMADILQSKKIIMLITGTGKDKIVGKFLSRRISSLLPASFLWLHPNVTCLIDNNTIKTPFQ